ncbi:MAG: hypothetical protein EAY81_09420 [Bacteroidetes bacterium]|nr:MAG: hypothetical protein EAY81_09420 [Bacteroidota bacterium]
MVTVIKKDGTVRAVIHPDEGSQMERSLMGQDVVTVGISVAVAIPFAIGDSAVFFGEQYFLNSIPSVTKTARRNLQYRLVFESKSYDLAKTQYLFLNTINQFKDGKFTMTATALGFLQLIIYNLKRREPQSGWYIRFVEQTDEKTLEFDSNNCLETLVRLAQEFETEYIVDGYAISLYRKQDNSNITLKYGKNEGLYSLTRNNQDSSNVITRLYAYGSDKNLGNQYRNGAVRLRLSDEVYIEKLTEKYGIIEGTKLFEDVYPQRTGTITSVTSPLIFADSSMDFDLTGYLISEVNAKLVFKSGLLAGYEFLIADGGYNHGLKQFTILENREEQTKIVPSATYTPKVGDKYTLVDITMPPSYVITAEETLKTVAEKHLNDNCTPKLSYTLNCNPIWAKQNSISIKLGQTVELIDSDLGINQQIRCIGIKKNINQPYLISLELADTVVQTKLVKLINGI